MIQLIPGWIRQLTTRETPETFRSIPPRPPRPKEAADHQLAVQRNVRIQSAAADIVTKLIAADIIHSQRWDQVDEIIREVLFEAFGGIDWPNPPQTIVRSR